MNKKMLIAILAVTTAIVFSLMFIYYDATFLAQYDYKVSYLSLSHPDTRSGGLRILYLTDLEYGTYTDETHLEKIKKTVDALDYDVVIFGGDVFDDDYTPEGDDIGILTGFFKSLRGADGNFAIYGDYDLISEGRKNITTKILSDSGFEIIDDRVKVYLTSSRFINIYGCSHNSRIESPQDNDHLNITVIHDLSMKDQFPESALILCGNSHDRQLNWPLSAGYRPGYHASDRLYYSSGLGMTKTAHRLFCDPEIVIITLN